MKLALIDRDGVINRELAGYVTSPEELDIFPQAYEAFALLKRSGYRVAVVTNQSVVGRGIITRGALDNIHAQMCSKIEAHGGSVDEVFVCTDTPDKATSRRKPGPGMLLEALEKYGAVAEKTPFVGDALTDLEAAYGAGCRRYLVLTGKGKEHAERIPERLQPVVLCTDILDAVRKIIS